MQTPPSHTHTHMHSLIHRDQHKHGPIHPFALCLAPMRIQHIRNAEKHFSFVWTTGGRGRGGRRQNRVSMLCLSWRFRNQLARSTCSPLLQILMCLECWGPNEVRVHWYLARICCLNKRFHFMWSCHRVSTFFIPQVWEQNKRQWSNSNLCYATTITLLLISVF